MSESIVTYPRSFLSRPQDRMLLAELEAAGTPPDSARLMLYQCWVDFATGESDRRPIGDEPMAEDRQVRAMEQFVGWKGPDGDFVRHALMAGFLVKETTAAGSALVCSGFRALNRSKAGSMQRKGGLARALKAHLRDAVNDAEKREELWSRNGGGSFGDMPPQMRKDAMVFIIRVCRALGFPIPADSMLAAGIIGQAAACLTEHDPDAIESTLMWLFDHRSHPCVPDRLDNVFRSWSEFSSSAATES